MTISLWVPVYSVLFFAQIMNENGKKCWSLTSATTLEEIFTPKKKVI